MSLRISNIVYINKIKIFEIWRQILMIHLIDFAFEPIFIFGLTFKYSDTIAVIVRYDRKIIHVFGLLSE